MVAVFQAQGRLALGQRKGADAKLAFEKALSLREKQRNATNEALASSKTGIGQALQHRQRQGHVADPVAQPHDQGLRDRRAWRRCLVIRGERVGRHGCG